MPKYKNFSPQAKSFMILFAIAVVGTYLTVMVSEHALQLGQNYYGGQGFYYRQSPGSVKSATERYLPDFKPVDTSSWKTYTDKSYPFSFMYDPGWKVLPGKKQKGFYVLQLDPGPKFYNIKIYVNDSGFYYAMDGLPYLETDINGAKFFNLSNLLYVIKMGPYYYTFDDGLSANKLIDDFNALVRTVKFY